MPDILVPLLGKDVATVTCRFMTQASDGELTADATNHDITLTLDGVEYDGADDEEDISPVTSDYENPVSIRANDTYTLIQWMRPTSGKNTLATVKIGGYLSSIAQIAYAVSAHTYDFIGVFSSYRESVRQGRSVMMMDLQIVDTFDDAATPVPTDNPLYT